MLSCGEHRQSMAPFPGFQARKVFIGSPRPELFTLPIVLRSPQTFVILALRQGPPIRPRLSKRLSQVAHNGKLVFLSHLHPKTLARVRRGITPENFTSLNFHARAEGLEQPFNNRCQLELEPMTPIGTAAPHCARTPAGN